MSSVCFADYYCIGKLALHPLRPLLKYKHSSTSVTPEKTWIATRMIGSPSLKNGSDTAMFSSHATENSNSNASSTSVERLQKTIEALENENQRWQDANSKLYTIALEKVSQEALH